MTVFLFVQAVLVMACFVYAVAIRNATPASISLLFMVWGVAVIGLVVRMLGLA